MCINSKTMMYERNCASSITRSTAAGAFGTVWPVIITPTLIKVPKMKIPRMATTTIISTSQPLQTGSCGGGGAGAISTGGCG